MNVFTNIIVMIYNGISIIIWLIPEICFKNVGQIEDKKSGKNIKSELKKNKGINGENSII